MPEKPRKPRFGERRDDDDDDDDRPAKKKFRGDDEDDSPRKPKKKSGGGASPLLLIVGSGAVLLLLLSCCGVGGYFAFSGGGSGLGISRHFELTSANLSGGGRNTNINISFDMKAAVEANAAYWVVVRVGPASYETPLILIGVAPNAKGTFGAPLPGWNGPAIGAGGEVWIEKRAGSSKTVVSNTLSLR